MSQVTISKTEYSDLKARAVAYDRMLDAAQTPFHLSPPEQSRKKIVGAFKKTLKYNKLFFGSLSKGLKRSNYFKA
jgi:hypothetical protein